MKTNDASHKRSFFLLQLEFNPLVIGIRITQMMQCSIPSGNKLVNGALPQHWPLRLGSSGMWVSGNCVGFFRAGLDWSCGLSCGALVKEDGWAIFWGGSLLKMTSLPGDSGKTVLCTSASAQLGNG